MGIDAWTAEKPNASGWYWYKGDTDIDAVVVWVAPNMHLINLSHKGPVRAFDGKWLGPITPDSFQQGRVAGLREAVKQLHEGVRLAQSREVADALSGHAYTLDRIAQQAQEER